MDEPNDGERDAGRWGSKVGEEKRIFLPDVTFVSAGQAPPLHKKLTGAIAPHDALPSEATSFNRKECEELEEASNYQCGPCEPEKDDVIVTSSHCLVKVYDDYTEGTFKMNQVVEFVGILGFEPLQTIFNSGDGNQVCRFLSCLCFV